MAEYDFKFPTSQEEYDEMKKALRSEISDDELNAVVGGNDDPNMKGKNKGTPWVCPGCGATIMIRQFQDGPKHMTKCPGNPYK